MANMKMFFACCMMGASILATSCSSSGEEMNQVEGKGSLRFSVKADAGFSNKTLTRAVDLDAYNNVDNYTVDIKDESGNSAPTFPKLYSEVKGETFDLKNGSYTVVAHYGEEKNASQNTFLVTGESRINIQGELVENVAVECQPTCAKLVVNFAADMSDYFNDYSVVFKTAALTGANETAVCTKNDSEPFYAKVAKAGEEVVAVVSGTRKSDNKTATAEFKRTLAPNQAWTLSVGVSNKDGNLGFVITIDESTNDHEVDIVVPSDWI